MSSTTKWWVAASLAVGVIVVGCASTDDGGGSDGSDADAGADPAASAEATPATATSGEGDATGAQGPSGASTGSLIFGDEAIPIARFRCFFEEQPRAGLGGVFTHSAQGEGTNAAGEAVLLDMTRARAEDDTIEDHLSVGIGDPFGDDYVEYNVGGPEGLIEFGDASAAASDVEVSDFSSDTSFTITFDLPCS